LRAYIESGKLVYTTCGFYVTGPFGQPISYDESVILDTDNETVIGFVEYDTMDSLNGIGPRVTYNWTTEVDYDEFPYRCGHGGCVPAAAYCALDLAVNPPCGVNGLCLVDGTCECYAGTTTFLLTPELTALAQVPYDATNPTIWVGVTPSSIGESIQCQSRDCSDGVTCEIPYGCFPGSKEKNFKDTQTVCTLESGNYGSCGIDVAR